MTYAEAIGRSYAWLEHQLLQAAEVMPAEKFNFRPTPEVRTFAEQLRHIATVQWVVGAWLQGAKPPAEVGDGDNGPPSMSAKADILNYLRDSFAYIRTSRRPSTSTPRWKPSRIPTIPRTPS
jgi:DinB superfamily